MEPLQRILSSSREHKILSRPSLSTNVLIAGLKDKVSHATHSSILPLELWDSPGKEDVSEEDTLQLLREVNAVVFVIDINVCRRFYFKRIEVSHLDAGPLVQRNRAIQ